MTTTCCRSTSPYSQFIQDFMGGVTERNPYEPEFLQAVQEVVCSLEGVMNSKPQYLSGNILQRIVEPERVIHFRVPWVNDAGEVNVNRGYRIEFNSAIGP
ncbi:MAG TPA: NADP-specific glutamate dehydrogenase, partial [Phycisphaerales bacterium]|nr:NADP-specific glutamate dehydrogenase [Phycisphaerales bacterium]